VARGALWERPDFQGQTPSAVFESADISAGKKKIIIIIIRENSFPECLGAAGKGKAWWFAPSISAVASGAAKWPQL